MTVSRKTFRGAVDGVLWEVVVYEHPLKKPGYAVAQTHDGVPLWVANYTSSSLKSMAREMRVREERQMPDLPRKDALRATLIILSENGIEA